MKKKYGTSSAEKKVKIAAGRKKKKSNSGTQKKGKDIREKGEKRASTVKRGPKKFL